MQSNLLRFKLEYIMGNIQPCSYPGNLSWLKHRQLKHYENDGRNGEIQTLVNDSSNII